jgi:hypothetical protein
MNNCFALYQGKMTTSTSFIKQILLDRRTYILSLEPDQAIVFTSMLRLSDQAEDEKTFQRWIDITVDLLAQFPPSAMNGWKDVRPFPSWSAIMRFEMDWIQRPWIDEKEEMDHMRQITRISNEKYQQWAQDQKQAMKRISWLRYSIYIASATVTTATVWFMMYQQQAYNSG